VGVVDHLGRRKTATPLAVRLARSSDTNHRRVNGCFSRNRSFAVDLASYGFVPIFAIPAALQCDREAMNECPELGNGRRAISVHDWVIPSVDAKTNVGFPQDHHPNAVSQQAA
jgi:hypothetical protein